MSKVEDIVASENYDDNSKDKIVYADDVKLYKYYKEVSTGKFVVSEVSDERNYTKDKLHPTLIKMNNEKRSNNISQSAWTRQTQVTYTT